MADHVERWGAATGLVFFAFIPVLFVLAGDQPELGSTAQEVFRYQVEKMSSIHKYLILWSVATVPLLWFLGTLLGALRTRDSSSSLPTIATLSAVVGMIGIYTTIILEGAAAFRPAAYGVELTSAMWDMSYVFQPVLGLGLGVFLFAVALLILRTDLLPSWLGWLTLAPAAGNLVYIGQIAKNDGYFLGEPGFPAFVLWVALTSVVLLFRQRHFLTSQPAGVEAQARL